MATLDDLKKRIASVKSTQKITKAMKMVAAAKLRKAQENAERGRPYSEKMQNIILNLTESISDPSNAPKLLVGNGKEQTYLCVVMTADRGLCGDLPRPSLPYACMHGCWDKWLLGQGPQPSISLTRDTRTVYT